mmetsp:Transcript_11840/g.26912  ORF Transcript_11840/g.26912 Transcript_11840/m.26912 type:complete len:296 (+) Transcript_11840:138-1025(+)
MPSSQNADEAKALLEPSAGAKKRRGVFRPLDFMIAVILPWMVFVLLMSMFSFGFTDYAIIAKSLMGTCLGVTLLLVFVGCVRQGRRVQLFLGIACSIAILFGALTGKFAYTHYLEDYISTESGAHYHNVSPAESAAAHADASLLQFQEGSIVNVAMGSSYEHEGITYCVAPVQPGFMELTQPQYWAVGLDCCEAHGSFNCGDVSAPNARQGMVETDDVLNYLVAARMASQAHGLDALDDAQPPMFLRWISDYEEHSSNAYLGALSFVVVAAGIYLLLSLLVASIVARTVKHTSAD